MKFTVLMTTYYKETADNLNASLKSITDEQTVLPDQIVLVLDGPIGDELEQVVFHYIKKYPEVVEVVRLLKNVGQGIASAEGIKYCKNDYIARMDSDDISINTRFETQISILEQNPSISIVGGYIIEYEENPNVIGLVRNVPERHLDICKMFRFRNPINNVTVMYRKDILEKAGGYGNERVNEDFSIYVRMLIAGGIFYNIPKILVKVRIGNNMVQRRRDMNIFFAWCKNQKLLLDSKKTNILWYMISCLGCLFFIVIPSNFKKILYDKILRKPGISNS